MASAASLSCVPPVFLRRLGHHLLWHIYPPVLDLDKILHSGPSPLSQGFVFRLLRLYSDCFCRLPPVALGELSVLLPLLLQSWMPSLMA